MKFDDLISLVRVKINPIQDDDMLLDDILLSKPLLWCMMEEYELKGKK